ncbi:MAG: PilZ domain-containing protein, partial [Hyphomicrobiaceae bacterium]
MLFERPLASRNPQSSFETDPEGAAIDERQELNAEALLLRALVHEVQTAAMLTAVAASAVNTGMSPRLAILIAEARFAIADFPARIDDWPQRILQEQLTRSSFEDVAVFYAAFGKAKARLLALEAEANRQGLERALSLNIASLQTSWRLAARHARIAVSELTGELKHVLPDGYATNLATIDALLTASAKGESPCLTAQGHVEVPRLAERRRTPRRSLLQTAIVSIGRSDFSAFVLDVSAGGFGLSRMPPVTAGLRLIVRLQSVRVFSGTIAWSEG